MSQSSNIWTKYSHFQHIKIRCFIFNINSQVNKLAHIYDLMMILANSKTVKKISLCKFVFRDRFHTIESIHVLWDPFTIYFITYINIFTKHTYLLNLQKHYLTLIKFLSNPNLCTFRCIDFTVIIKIQFPNWFRIAAWALAVKLLSCECHRTSLIRSQHW